MYKGSGITIYVVLRSSIHIGINLDGALASTFKWVDDNTCLHATSPGCFNYPIYSAQSLEYGDHNVELSMLTVDPSAKNLSYSDFYFDYATVNETLMTVTPPTPVISPAATLAPAVGNNIPNQ